MEKGCVRETTLEFGIYGVVQEEGVFIIVYDERVKLCVKREIVREILLIRIVYICMELVVKVLRGYCVFACICSVSAHMNHLCSLMKL